ncbi:MAG: SDR family NAD(P)-dependent oxidoreductase [Rhodobacteraceae bacterium]|nr:SDR family NAD(P)-dependent oxidoreductase [Paracoccaceae bacterium]
MTILVTGANRGIGLELVRQYAEMGETVIATTRNRIPAELDHLAEWHILDVTDQASFDGLNSALDGRAVSVVICNAGIYLDKPESLAQGFKPELWQQTFAVNVTGAFLTVQNLLPNLQAAGNARIAIIASKMGLSAHAKGGSYIYRASKAAAINLAANLAHDLKPLDIAVGAYHPGWVRTDMGGKMADVDIATSAGGLIERIRELGPETTGGFLAYDGEKLD